MSNTRNLGELLESDGEVPSSKIDSVAATKLTGTVADARLSATRQAAKLTLSGGAMTGAITTNSTFDGRDVGTDGTKLDTIATNANLYVHPNHSGDVVSTADGATVIQVDAVDIPMLSATGTASNTTFLRGDNAWAVPIGGVTSVNSETGAITAAHIATAVEAASDSNTFTDADHTKLNAIEASADVTDTTNVVAALTAGTGVTISGGGTIAAGPIALTTVQTAANQSAHLALTAQEGDIVVRSDENKTYCHNGGSAGNMTDYTLLATPTDVVLSVAGNTGAVTAAQIATAVEAASGSNTFTDADHTKLNAIEASADVTDATNVTAAGALMDSEVTNLAAVKSFAASDYATAAQGTTADAALPKAGGTMTGNIAHAGNFTLDVEGDLNFDANGSDINLLDGGTEFGRFKQVSNGMRIMSTASDADMTFMGNDGGSEFTALTLDMSEAGYATFNNWIKVNDRVVGNSNLVLNTSDGNEKIHLDASGYMKFETAGSERMRIGSSGNVGIGTTTTNARLQLGIGAKTTMGSATHSAIKIGQSTGAPAIGNLTQIIMGAASNTYGPIAIGGRLTDTAVYGKDAFFIATRDATSDSAPTERFCILPNGNVGIGDTTPDARLDLGALTSNTPGSNPSLRIGQFAFRNMTGGEGNVLNLDRDMDGTPTVFMAMDPGYGRMGINVEANNTGLIRIKANSLTEPQIALVGSNYGYSSQMMHQNGSESGTVGNTRGWYKHDIYTLGSTRRFWTAASQVGTDYQYWSTNNTERMRIDTNGLLLLDGAPSNTSGRISMKTGNYHGICIDSNGSSQYIGSFNKNGQGTGSITTSSSNCSYNTSSDYRLKENIVDMTGAITRLKTLQPKRFNWIRDETNTLQDGFIAHEVTAVPESIHGVKDAMTTEILYTQDDVDQEIVPAGKNIGDVKVASIIDPQQIDQSKLVPLLVGALQEAITRIETLENA